MVLAALSDSQKTGIALMGAAFIVFALISSFVIPRRWPNFPGRHLWAYVAVVACFFAGMMAVVIVVARETKQAEAKPPATSPAPPPSTPQPPGPTGDPAAGKAVFTSAGCASCHTYTPAASTGTTGPNLDNLAADAKQANRGTLDQYVHESIVAPDAYIVPKCPNGPCAKGTMPANFGQTLKPQQIADLVAFLTKPS